MIKACGCNFCKIIRDDSLGLKICQEIDEKFAEECMKTGKITKYKCHAGMLDLAIPIPCGDQIIGAILCGQVISNESKQERLKEIIEFSEKTNINKETLLNYMKIFHNTQFKN